MSKQIIEILLPLKPFSANRMKQRNLKNTVEYRKFKGDIKELIEGDYGVEKDDRLRLTLISGFSNKASDLDNSFKPLLDAMQICMGFDDKQIYEIRSLKDIVPKGEEYIYVKLDLFPDSNYVSKIARWLKEVLS